MLAKQQHRIIAHILGWTLDFGVILGWGGVFFSFQQLFEGCPQVLQKVLHVLLRQGNWRSRGIQMAFPRLESLPFAASRRPVRPPGPPRRVTARINQVLQLCLRILRLRAACEVPGR